MVLDAILGVVGAVVTVGMPLALLLLKSLRDDTREVKKELHTHRVQTERRLTLLEAKVFGFEQR